MHRRTLSTMECCQIQMGKHHQHQLKQWAQKTQYVFDHHKGSIKALRCWMKLFLGFDVRIWPLLYIMKLCYSTKHIYNVNKYRIAYIYVHIYQCAISCRYDAENASFATRCDQNIAWLKWCVFQKYYICILYILIFVFVFTTVNCVLDHEVCPKPLHS